MCLCLSMLFVRAHNMQTGEDHETVRVTTPRTNEGPNDSDPSRRVFIPLPFFGRCTLLMVPLPPLRSAKSERRAPSAAVTCCEMNSLEGQTRARSVVFVNRRLVAVHVHAMRPVSHFGAHRLSARPPARARLRRFRPDNPDMASKLQLVRGASEGRGGAD